MFDVEPFGLKNPTAIYFELQKILVVLGFLLSLVSTITKTQWILLYVRFLLCVEIFKENGEPNSRTDASFCGGCEQGDLILKMDVYIVVSKTNTS